MDLIPLLSLTENFFRKAVFTASLFVSQQEKESAKKRPASLLVSSGNAFNGIFPSFCGSQMAGSSCLESPQWHSLTRLANSMS